MNITELSDEELLGLKKSLDGGASTDQPQVQDNISPQPTNISSDFQRIFSDFDRKTLGARQRFGRVLEYANPDIAPVARTVTENLPAIMGTLGTFGMGNPVVGAGLGELGRQSARYITGQETSPSALVKTPAVYAGTGLVTRAISAPFRIPYLKEAVGNAIKPLGKMSGRIMGTTQGRTFQSLKPFIDKAESLLGGGAKAEQREIRKPLEVLINDMKNYGGPANFDVLRSFERRLGDLANFQPAMIGVGEAAGKKMAKNFQKSATNKALKELRRQFSGKVDEIARLSGEGGWKEASMKLAGKSRELSEATKGKMLDISELRVPFVGARLNLERPFEQIVSNVNKAGLLEPSRAAWNALRAYWPYKANRED